jgi:Protein of unknown function (DUF2804)
MGQSEPMRILKRWRYVGVWGPDVMLCAGVVRVGGVPQSFWAVWDREAHVLTERTRRRLGTVALPDGAARVRDDGVAIDLVLAPAGEPVAVTSDHDGGEIHTRKTPATARGRVALGARTIEVDAPALVDDSSGRHARETAWEWCAGAGRSTDGRAVVWNLVSGIHDAPRGSERAVWVDGARVEPPPVVFGASLDAVGDLRFAAEAQRARHDRVLFGLVESEYRQPFGTFSGTLPGGVALAAGYGVMERHRARW